MAKVREAIMIIEKALPELPVASDMHKAVIDALGKLTKAFPATAAMPGIQSSTLLGLQRDARESSQIQQLMAQAGKGGAPGGQPQQPPQAGAPAGVM